MWRPQGPCVAWQGVCLKVTGIFVDSAVCTRSEDEVVESYKRQPVMSMEERAAVVEACRWVDEVIRDAPLHLTQEYLERHNIDLVVHGDDISLESEKQMYKVPIALGMYQKIPYTAGVSTTDVIQRVVSRSADSFQSKQKVLT